jgi:hypothetical protein
MENTIQKNNSFNSNDSIENRKLNIPDIEEILSVARDAEIDRLEDALDKSFFRMGISSNFKQLVPFNSSVLTKDAIEKLLKESMETKKTEKCCYKFEVISSSKADVEKFIINQSVQDSLLSLSKGKSLSN